MAAYPQCRRCNKRNEMFLVGLCAECLAETTPKLSRKEERKKTFKGCLIGVLFVAGWLLMIANCVSNRL